MEMEKALAASNTEFIRRDKLWDGCFLYGFLSLQ